MTWRMTLNMQGMEHFKLLTYTCEIPPRTTCPIFIKIQTHVIMIYREVSKVLLGLRRLNLVEEESVCNKKVKTTNKPRLTDQCLANLLILVLEINANEWCNFCFWVHLVWFRPDRDSVQILSTASISANLQVEVISRWTCRYPIGTLCPRRYDFM